MKKKILGVAMAAVVALSAVPSVNAATVASGEAGYNAEWVFSDDGTLTISGSGNMYNGALNFFPKEVESIIIKNGVTSIGSDTLRDCENAKSIEIPQSIITIGSYALFDGEFYSINLPNGITSIGRGAFEQCDGLVEIKIPELVTRIQSNVCYSCSNLRKVYIPAGITEIEDSAFEDCTKITDVFFAGSAEQWNNIVIGKGNTYLTGATIHYNNAEGEYPYEISTLSLRSNSGEYIDAVPENESCIVNIGVTERLSRAERDYVFAALYDEDEQLVGMNYIRADFSAAHGCEFGLNIPKQTQKIGKIKAFIWSSFENMTPLCEAKELDLK